MGIDELYALANGMTRTNAKASLVKAYRIVDGAPEASQPYLKSFLETLAMTYEALTGRRPPE